MVTLSNLLTFKPDFNQSNTVIDPYNLKTIISLIVDLLDYVKVLDYIFEDLQHTRSTNPNIFTLNWYCEGKSKFNELYKNVESIDSLLLQIINILDSNIDRDPLISQSDVFEKIDELTEKCLLLKQQYLISFKSKVDLATVFEEFNNTLNSINLELENCLKLCIEIHEKKLSSPFTTTFNLETLIKNLFKQKSNLRLPLFNTIDQEIYQEYQKLSKMVDPLKVSLELIPPRIEEIKVKYFFQTNLINIGTIEERYESLVKELNYLTNELEDLKNEIVDKKWNDIFGFLNTETEFMIGSIERELKNCDERKEENILKIKQISLTVQKTFDVLHIAIDEDLVDLSVMEKSNELALNWLDLRKRIPTSYLEEEEEENLVPIEKTEQDVENDLVENMKLLTLGKIDTDSNHVSMTKREKRRSRAGEFFMGKLNIIPVLIEDQKTSSSRRNSLSKESIFNRSPQLIQEGFQIKQRNQNVEMITEQLNKFNNNSNHPDVITEIDTPLTDKIIKVEPEENDVFISPNINKVVKPKELKSYKIPDFPKEPITLDTKLFESRPSKIPRPISKAASIRQERPISFSLITGQLSSRLSNSESLEQTPSRNSYIKRQIPRPSTNLDAMAYKSLDLNDLILSDSFPSSFSKKNSNSLLNGKTFIPR